MKEKKWFPLDRKSVLTDQHEGFVSARREETVPCRNV